MSTKLPLYVERDEDLPSSLQKVGGHLGDLGKGAKCLLIPFGDWGAVLADETGGYIPQPRARALLSVCKGRVAYEYAFTPKSWSDLINQVRVFVRRAKAREASRLRKHRSKK